MKRRHFNGLLLAMPATSVLASVSNSGQEVNPYTQINPPIQADAHTVRAFFMYSCPYCRMAHNALARWGSSLPAKVEYRETPVVGVGKNSMGGALGFYAMKSIAPQGMPAFHDYVYRQIQDKGRVPSDHMVYAEAAKAAGVSMDLFAKAWRSDAVAALVRGAAELTAKYQIVSTPTVSAGGVLTITPEITGGINDTFFTLANAIVSKTLSDQGGLL